MKAVSAAVLLAVSALLLIALPADTDAVADGDTPDTYTVTVTADTGCISMNGFDCGRMSAHAYPYGTAVITDGDTLLIGDDVYVISSDDTDTVGWSVQGNLTHVLRDMTVRAEVVAVPGPSDISGQISVISCVVGVIVATVVSVMLIQKRA